MSVRASDAWCRGMALNPEWDQAGKVHDWRNYISDEVRAMWETFTLDQKAALVAQAENAANNEEWD